MAWTEPALHDLRLAIRSWRRTPGVALAAATMLALGLGATTAIFSVVSGVLLRPLPFPHPDELVQLSVSNPAEPRLGATFVTNDILQMWRQSAVSLQHVSTYSVFSQNLQRVTVPEQVATVRADGSFFATLGVPAFLGSTFGEGDPPGVAVASFSFWQRHLDADRAAIGRSITLDGESVTIVGVMPEGFQFPYRTTQTDLWTRWVLRAPPDARLDGLVARLKPGVPITAAQRELTALSGQTKTGRYAIVRPIAEVIGGPVRESLLVLLVAVGLVLLVACANIASLLLARAAARRQEVAIRVALGAGRATLLRQFLTESLLLAGVSTLAGLAIGKWASRLLLNLAADQIPRAWEIGFDWRVFTFSCAAGLVTGVGFGILPATRAAGGDLQRDLKRGERGASASGRLRDSLVVGEIAVAFVLLVGAGLLLRTFLNLRDTPSGFNPQGALTLHVVVTDAEESRALEQRVARIPGVRSAGFISLLPLQNSNWSGWSSIVGRPAQVSAEFRYVTPGYFDAMGIPIRRGRAFSDRDSATTPKVLIVNSAFANQFLPNEDPVGRVVTDRGTIVGVVGDVHQVSLEHAAVPEIYYPIAQNFAQLRSVGSSLIVRTDLPPESLVGTIRQAVREVNPNQATFRVLTLAQVVENTMGSQKLYLWLLGVFAALSTLLASAGVYSVIAYLVTLRTREFGIRMALGADSRNVSRLVISRGGVLVGLGLSIGLTGAYTLSRFLKSILFGVTTTDPVTIAGGALLLAAVALMACLVPARRAGRVDPVVALRAE
jgi:putative ABC transport system permease protein